MELSSLPLAAGVGDLLAFLVFVGFLIVRALAERGKKPGPPRPRPRRPPAVPPDEAEPQQGAYTWRDLLEGRVPEPPLETGSAPRADAPPSAPGPPATARPVSRIPVEQPPRELLPEDLFEEESFEDDLHEHEGPLAPREVLGQAPSEDELERHGGDRVRELTRGPLDQAPEARAHVWREDLGVREERSRKRRVRSGWRGAVVSAELLGAPLALRPPGRDGGIVPLRGPSST